MGVRPKAVRSTARGSGAFALLIGSVQVTYRVIRSQRKRVAIEVNPDLSIVVRVPEQADASSVRRIVAKRARWISRQIRFFESFLPRTPPRRLVSGESHRYLGRQYQLRIRRSTEERVKLEGAYLTILTATPESLKIKSELLDRWYRIHAARVFAERLAACSAHPELQKKRHRRVCLRTMTKRWGSCSPSGILTLNVALVRARRSCIDYVITHELCHLLVRTHSPRFTRLLDRIMPDWRERKVLLERTLA
jgi:predicted metal-dependent hydrolase